MVDVPDDPANMATRYEMQAEVTAFINRGMSEHDATNLVGLSRRDFYMVSGSGQIGFLPTPAEIATATQRMRAGEHVCSVASQQRWTVENEKLDSASTDDDQFELAGRISDDDCPVPSWLYSGGK